MRAVLLLLMIAAFSGCASRGEVPSPADDDALGPAGTDEPAQTNGPAPSVPQPWADLGVGLGYNGTGATVLMAEIRLGTSTDCELSVATDYNSTGIGVQVISQFREEGGGSMTGSFHHEAQAVQAGPVDTRSGADGGPSWVVFGFGVDGDGTLFVGVANAQPFPDEDPVPQGTIYVSSTCAGATGRWTVVGLEPAFFTSDTPDGAFLVSTTAGTGLVIAGARSFDHTVSTPKAVLVANNFGNAPGILQLAAEGGTQTWNLANERRIWNEGPGGRQSVSLTQAGPGMVLGALFGVPA